MIDDSHFGYLQPTYAALMGIFSSRAGVATLRNKVFVGDLVELGCNSAADALNKAEKGDPDYDILKKIYDDFAIMKNFLR
ncbi:hypothetical protein D3C71_2016710 [compost metagenome]